MLREEIMWLMREIYRTEWIAAVAVGAVYTWLVLHQATVPTLLWSIPPFVILLAALRCLTLAIAIRMIAAYLRRIEEITFVGSDTLPGWERYLLFRPQRSLRVFANVFTGVMWVVVMGASIATSWFLSRWVPPGP